MCGKIILSFLRKKTDKKTAGCSKACRSVLFYALLAAAHRAVGIVHGESVFIVTGENDVMSGGRKVAGSHGAYYRAAFFDSIDHILFDQRKLFGAQPEVSAALGHECPGSAAAFGIIAILLSPVSHGGGIPSFVTGQVERQHGHAGGAAACPADQSAAVFLVTPALVPLQQQRNCVLCRLGREVNGRAFILFTGVIHHIIDRFAVFQRQGDQVF